MRMRSWLVQRVLEGTRSRRKRKECCVQLMDVQNMLRKEACALAMVQHIQRNYAALMDARIKRAKVKIKHCSSEGCTHIVVNGGLCIKHGAKVKLCSSERCTNKAKLGGVCIKHGATMKRCSHDGCINQVARRGVCKKHGAYRHTHDESTAFGS